MIRIEMPQAGLDYQHSYPTINSPTVRTHNKKGFPKPDLNNFFSLHTGNLDSQSQPVCKYLPDESRPSLKREEFGTCFCFHPPPPLKKTLETKTEGGVKGTAKWIFRLKKFFLFGGLRPLRRRINRR